MCGILITILTRNKNHLKPPPDQTPSTLVVLEPEAREHRATTLTLFSRTVQTVLLNSLDWPWTGDFSASASRVAGIMGHTSTVPSSEFPTAKHQLKIISSGKPWGSHGKLLPLWKPLHTWDCHHGAYHYNSPAGLFHTAGHSQYVTAAY